MIDEALPLVYAATAIVTGSLAVLTWRNRHRAANTAITGVLVAITAWLVAIIAGGLTADLSTMLLWSSVALTGLCVTIAFLFVFSLRYAGHGEVLAGRRGLVLAVHPLLVAFFTLTNDGTGITLLGYGGHDLIYESVRMGSYSSGNVEWGTGFWVHTAFSYLLVAASTVLVLKTTLTSNDTYRWQSMTVGVAILVPWVSNVLDLFVAGVDGLLALGFGLSAILLAVSVQRFELSKLSPVARPVVMEAVADGVLVVNARGRVVDANERARTLLGSPDDSLLGATASEAFPPALSAFVDPVTAPERERVHVDGRTLEVETTPFDDDATPTPDVDGEPADADAVDPTGAGRVFVLRDVTEQHAYREELERKTERLDRFASVVSHDLRNPLSVAQGYLDIAAETGDADAFENVRASHDRMESLIEDVLLMAREGETSTDPEAVRVGVLAERAWATVDTPNADFDVRDPDAIVRADPDRTVQLFENLFRNSVEHGSTSNRTQSGDAREHGGETVTVTVGELDADADRGASASDGDRETTGFFVADDGAGIDPAVADELFETGVTGGDGTGLGLAIVDRIASAHDWSVEATESADGGARFEFRGVDPAPATAVADARPDAGADEIPDDPFA